MDAKKHPIVRPQLRSCANEAFSFKTSGGAVEYQTDVDCKLTEILFTWQGIEPHQSHYLLNQSSESFDQVESDGIVRRNYRLKSDAPAALSHQKEFDQRFIELRRETEKQIVYYETAFKPKVNRFINSTFDLTSNAYGFMHGLIFTKPASE